MLPELRNGSPGLGGNMRYHGAHSHLAMNGAFDFDQVLNRNKRYFHDLREGGVRNRKANKSTQLKKQKSPLKEADKDQIYVGRGKFKQKDISLALQHGLSKDLYTIEKVN